MAARLRSGRLTTGGLIVLVGLLLLLSTTDLVATENLWDYLPLVFVALGVWAVVRSGFRNLTGPVMVVAVAGTFQARNLGYVTDAQIGEWWPLFVVLFGVLYVLGRSRRTRGVSVDTGDAGTVSMVSVFSGTQRRVTGTGFRGGDVFAAFGGAELDLRDATVSDPPATVECLVAFGGADLHVPEDWTVELDVLSVFGGSEDAGPPAGDGGDRDTDLVVTGLALFGGVTVER